MGASAPARLCPVTISVRSLFGPGLARRKSTSDIPWDDGEDIPSSRLMPTNVPSEIQAPGGAPGQPTARLTATFASSISRSLALGGVGRGNRHDVGGAVAEDDHGLITLVAERCILPDLRAPQHLPPRHP